MIEKCPVRCKYWYNSWRYELISCQRSALIAASFQLDAWPIAAVASAQDRQAGVPSAVASIFGQAVLSTHATTLMITTHGQVVNNDRRWPLARPAYNGSSEPFNYQYVRCFRLLNISSASCFSHAMLSKTPVADIEGPVWHRFVRFVAEDGLEYCGQPDSEEVDGKWSLLFLSMQLTNSVQLV